MEISSAEAREILTINNIELDINDSRTAQQYVTELLVYIEAIKIDNDKSLIRERYKSAQSISPYFA